MLPWLLLLMLLLLLLLDLRARPNYVRTHAPYTKPVARTHARSVGKAVAQNVITPSWIVDYVSLFSIYPNVQWLFNRMVYSIFPCHKPHQRQYARAQAPTPANTNANDAAASAHAATIVHKPYICNARRQLLPSRSLRPVVGAIEWLNANRPYVCISQHTHTHMRCEIPRG